jgi:hypothetical protein
VRHDEWVQTQQNRDEKTVVIATALGLFCLVLGIAALGLWAADSLLGLSDSVTTPLTTVFVIAAGAMLVVYLVRARTRSRRPAHSRVPGR